MKNFNTNIDQDLLKQLNSLHLREKHSEIIDIATEECLDSSCLKKMELREFQEIGFDHNSISELNWMKKYSVHGHSFNQRTVLCSNATEKKKYGELLILGHQTTHSQSLFSIGIPRERFQLYRRSDQETNIHSGVIFFKQENTTQRQEVKFPPEYSSSEVDVYQIGRGEGGSVNDWIIPSVATEGSGKYQRSSIGKYLCRIVCDRNPPHRCRIYAGGFNTTKELILSVSSPQWRNFDGSFDGLTNSGVFLWHPIHRSWNEVTVRGQIVNPRHIEGSTIFPGESLDERSNELIPGSIIDLGGCLIYFQSDTVQSKEESPRSIIKTLNDLQPQCPVLFQPIHFDETPTHKARQKRLWEYLKSSEYRAVCSRNPNGTEFFRNDLSLQPYVFSACGHVYGYSRELEGRLCPLCRKVGPYVPLLVCIDQSICPKFPTHVFNPCGHAVSLEICQQWSEISLPDLTKRMKSYAPRCPFCLMKLAEVNPFRKLIIVSEGQRLG